MLCSERVGTFRLEKMRQRHVSHVTISRQRRFSERGFTITEVAITVAVIMIVTIGSGYLFQDMARVQKRAASVSAISSMRTQIIAAIEGTHVTDLDVAQRLTAWDKTLSDQTPTVGNQWAACLLNNTPCLKNDRTAPHVLALRNADNTELFNARVADRGFDSNGNLCTGFGAPPTNPSCIFRWALDVFFSCPTETVGTECENPIVEVQGALLFGGEPEVIGGPLNLDQFKFSARRGERKNLNEPVVISYVQTGNLTEAGVCSNPTGTVRQFNRIVNDVGNNAQLSGGTNFGLKFGIYECRIQVPAFRTGTNHIELRTVADDAVVAASETVVASQADASSIAVTLHATVRVPGNDPTFRRQYQVVHFCSGPMPVPPAAVFPLGIPVPLKDGGGAPDYTGGSTFSTISCVKTG